MTDLQHIPSTKKLQTNIKKLGLRFPIKDISEKTGFNKGSVSSYVNGKIPPSIPFIKKFAEVFDLNLEDLEDRDEVIKTKHESPTGFYFPDITASAGLDLELNNGELNKIPVNIPGWEIGIYFINVYGDSMTPVYTSGQIVGIKEVEFQYINYGYAYVVVFNDGQVFLKYVKKGKDNEHVILESENKKYEPKEFHISLLKKIYIIKGSISKTTI